MREEINMGVGFLARLCDRILSNALFQQRLDNATHAIRTQQYHRDMDRFSDVLTKLLVKKYTNHWYKDEPSRGSAYRCLLSNGFNCDPIISQAVHLSQLPYDCLIRALCSITLWIDPMEVTYRIEGRRPQIHNIAMQESNSLTRLPVDYYGIMMDINQVYEIKQISPCLRMFPSSSTISTKKPNDKKEETPKESLSDNEENHRPANVSPKSDKKKTTSNETRKPLRRCHSAEHLSCTIPTKDKKVEREQEKPKTTRPKGYCGYVESYPYYYKMNRLNKHLNVQKQQQITNANLLYRYRQQLRNAGHQYYTSQSPTSMYQQDYNKGVFYRAKYAADKGLSPCRQYDLAQFRSPVILTTGDILAQSHQFINAYAKDNRGDYH